MANSYWLMAARLVDDRVCARARPWCQSKVVVDYVENYQNLKFQLNVTTCLRIWLKPIFEFS